MSNVKRRSIYNRRRTRSVGSMPFTWQSQNVLLQIHQTQSDEICSSSTSKDKDCPTYYQSDSDDVCSGQYGQCFSKVCSSIPNNMESDSFNENSPYRRSTRKKRKFKRIAMEIEISSNNRFYPHSHAASSYFKRRRPMRHPLNCSGNRLWLSSGKRKRSTKEKFRNSMDGESSDFSRDSKVLALSKLSLDDYPREQTNSMDVSYLVPGISSSSISTSGSETEIFTNDEGREGDDEQSDWIGDVAIGGNLNPHEDTDKPEEMYRKYLCSQFETNDDKRTLRFFNDKGRDVDSRLSRRRNRLVRPNLTFVVPSDSVTSTSKFVPRLGDEEPSKVNKMDVQSSLTTRRHTFSGYKKRRRVPMNTSSNDNVSDKSSELFSAVHQLSDISSSDSKDSLK